LVFEKPRFPKCLKIRHFSSLFLFPHREVTTSPNLPAFYSCSRNSPIPFDFLPILEAGNFTLPLTVAFSPAYKGFHLL
ncbi:MAG: hypothetical protein OET79_13505, partial [Nitrospirota bacterium]|nr:hypothetical protein [Nitrospirota bacterium]